MGNDFKSKELQRARAQLVIKQPFIANILLSTQVEEDNNFPHPAATNGDKIVFNMKLIGDMAAREKCDLIKLTEFIAAHEVYHIAFMHPFRMLSDKYQVMVVDAAGQQVTLRNLAMDAVINESLIKDGFTVPSSAVTWPDADKKSAEEVFDEMLKQMKNNPKVKWVSFDDCQSNQGDDEKEGNEQESKGESQQVKEMKAKIKIQRALDIAKSYGKVPAGIQVLVEEGMEHKIPWQQLLRDFVTTITKKDDYTWSKLNRRHIWNKSYLPSLDGHACGPIFLAFDTSGSIGSKELGAFVSEMNGIFEECSPEIIMVGFCDSDFYRPHTELTKDELPMQAQDFASITKGGGGTAFSPVFNYIKDNNITPDMVIYFTDLCGSDFGDQPNYPVLWVSTHSDSAPWGQVIKLEV